MTSQEDQELRRWVIEHVRPGTDWLWTPRSGRPVAMRIHGFQGTGPDRTEKYEIELSFFLVKAPGGKWREVRSNASDNLPRWFLAAMSKPDVSRFSPYHIWSDTFKALVDSHQITSTQMIRYTLGG